MRFGIAILLDRKPLGDGQVNQGRELKTMKTFIAGTIMAACLGGMAMPAAAQGSSSGRQMQVEGQAEIPQCTRNLGTIAIVEPEDRWWRQYDLSSPETILRVFIQRSGCFSIVNRGRSMRSRAMERALAEQGELQDGSNVGGGQVRTADYFMEPDIVTANNNSGGGGLGAALGGLAGGLLGRRAGRIAGSIDVRKGEANVVLSVVNARTTVEEALTEGYAQKQDLGISARGSLWGGGGWSSAGASSYQNTEIGQIIVLAYLDAYTRLVRQLGGLPYDAATDAPEAR